AFGLHDTYSKTGGCQPGQPPSLLCGHGTGELFEDDRLGIRQAFCEQFPADCALRAEVPGWCPASRGYVQTGDFDLDGRTDLLCHEVLRGSQRVLLATENGFVDGALQGYVNTATPFCAGASRGLVIGDLNGDGRADLICHDQATGAIETAFTRDGVPFASVTGRHPVGWCAGSNRSLQVGDFNSDRHADLFCRRAGASGTDLLINLANSAGAFGRGFAPQQGWCGDVSMATLVVDLNRDGSSDVYCRNPAAPTVALATGTGQLGTVYSFPYVVWQTGDVSGDGQIDLMLWWPTYSGAVYGNAGLYPGVSRLWLSSFCKGAGDVLLLADVNRDGAEDYVCHQSSTGTIKVMRQPSPLSATALARRP
ncbi:MAG TPA: VCBS repeat-containing protein, partial [Polyangiales bacterium]